MRLLQPCPSSCKRLSVDLTDSEPAPGACAESRSIHRGDLTVSEVNRALGRYLSDHHHTRPTKPGPIKPSAC